MNTSWCCEAYFGFGLLELLWMLRELDRSDKDYGSGLVFYCFFVCLLFPGCSIWVGNRQGYGRGFPEWD